MNARTTVAFELERLRAALRQGGIESHDIDARLLLQAAAGLSPEDLILKASNDLNDNIRPKLEEMTARRLNHEPVSRILGQREFWGLPFKVTKDTLDPRPDTETLVEQSLKALEPHKNRSLKIADLGTGTGCLLLSLLSELPDATGVGIDVSLSAIKVAEENARNLGLADRVVFKAQDWNRVTETEFDWIVSNPPYISQAEMATLDKEVAGFDPHVALYGGRDGLGCYRELAGLLPKVLKPGGGAALEIGFLQAKAVCGIFDAVSLTIINVIKDLQGNDRCIIVKNLLSKPDGRG